MRRLQSRLFLQAPHGIPAQYELSILPSVPAGQGGGSFAVFHRNIFHRAKTGAQPTSRTGIIDF